MRFVRALAPDTDRSVAVLEDCITTFERNGSSAHGAILDSQAGNVELPSGVKRFAPIALLALSSWLDHAALLQRERIGRLSDLGPAGRRPAVPLARGTGARPEDTIDLAGGVPALRRRD